MHLSSAHRPVTTTMPPAYLPIRVMPWLKLRPGVARALLYRTYIHRSINHTYHNFHHLLLAPPHHNGQSDSNPLFFLIHLVMENPRTATSAHSVMIKQTRISLGPMQNWNNTLLAGAEDRIWSGGRARAYTAEAQRATGIPGT